MSSGNRSGPWDDSLLIKAFDNAVREHQKMHGVATDDKAAADRDELSEEDRQSAGGELKSFLLEEASGVVLNSETGVQPSFSLAAQGSQPEPAASVPAETTETSNSPSGVEQQAGDNRPADSTYEQSWQQYYESIGYPSSAAASYWPQHHPSSFYSGQSHGTEDAVHRSGTAAQPAQSSHCLCCTQSTTASASAPPHQFRHPVPWTNAPLPAQQSQFERQGFHHPPSHSTPAPGALQPGFHPHLAPPPTPNVYALNAAELEAMLHAWYQAGYVAGRVEGRASS